MDRIQHNEGVPRWFSYLFHRWSKWRWCNRRGHRDPELTRVCDVCGQYL